MYGMKLTPKIEQHLPVLLEFIRVMHPDYIPQEIAGAGTILYAIQEGMIERDGEVFTLLNDSSDDIICPSCGKGDEVSADAEPKSYYCYRCAEHFMRGVQP